MSALILNPVTAKALATADRIVASQDGDYHTLTIYPTSDYNYKSDLTVPGVVVGYQAYGEGRYTPGRSSASLYTSALSIFKLLKAGDAIWLEWNPDAYEEVTDQAGLIVQTLRLRIERKAGRDRTEYIDVLLNHSVHDVNSQWPMCRHFDVAGKVAERVMQREERRRQREEKRALQIEHVEAAE